MKLRAFGWIQNPSNLRTLKKVVQVFDPESLHYKKLRDHVIADQIIYFPEIRDYLLEKLQDGIAEFSYSELVGNSRDKYGNPTNVRKKQQANSLLQITILPQSVNTTGKHFTDNWSSDGFLRWAVSWNFISHNRETDLFTITELGIAFSRSEDESSAEQTILKKTILAYPPATQVLRILSELKEPCTKFYIGNRLGFSGENGFTSYEESTMLDWLSNLDTAKEQKTIRTNVEGTSDKYARMIAGWLKQLGFVKQSSSKLMTNKGEITSFPVYQITAQGQHALRQSEGGSKNKKITKFIKWEFLATKDSNANYLRTRRAYILKYLQETKSFKILLEKLSVIGFEDEPEIIKNDIQGLNNFGIRIELDGNKIVLKDSINDFDIPNLQITQTLVDIEKERKKAYFLKETSLSPRYIELLEIAFDPKRNRDFEVITAELLKAGYGLKAKVLGGGRRPDGIAYTKDYGLIVDTKAYSNGYGKNIGQADEMIRYIEDNQKRDNKRNPIEWWREFEVQIPANSYYYLWVSGRFTGRFDEQLVYTSSQTNTRGGALEVEQLLWGADAVMKGKLNVSDLPKYMNNSIIKLTKK